MTIEKVMNNNPLESSPEDERQFHFDRHARKADKDSERGFVSKLFNPERDTLDHALEETFRVSEDVERRNHHEFVEWQKSLNIVMDRLRRHKEAKESGKSIEGEEIRPLLLIMGAGMRAPYGMGQVIGLDSMGFKADTFDNVVGISAGACIASYYVAGDIEKGATMFWNELANEQFVDKTRIHNSGVVDVKMAAYGSLRDGPNKVDQDAIRNSGTGLFYGVTKPAKPSEPFREEFLDAKELPDMMRGIEATMTIPLITTPAGDGVEVEGQNYLDGSFIPLPIQDVIDRFNPTDVLVLPNIPFDKLEAFKTSDGENLFRKLVELGGKVAFPDAMAQIGKVLDGKKSFRESLEYIREQQGVNIAIAWPPDCGIGNLDTDADNMKATTLRSAHQMVKDCGGEKQQFDFYKK